MGHSTSTDMLHQAVTDTDIPAGTIGEDDIFQNQI
jgi:hypothetical protein